MNLERGTKLGPYEILEPIGAGGMGEVYKARDTRLDRTVAIKISTSQFTERFEREARAVAALNHAHICTLYDVGPDYLVMEFVDGPTLAERINAGSIPVEEALAIARQIAEALEAAHEKGIVHRDLKPANVKFTAGAGQIKVLDFGLAKALEPETGADPRSSPTLTLSATRTGVILGTAAYMSPEQARGIAADKRADIWSFGVVLYEMLTGRHLFGGETISDTLAGVLKTDPEWKALPAGTPAPIRRLLRRCLERDRKRRLHDIADAVLDIDEAQAEPKAPAVAARPKASYQLVPWLVAAGLIIALPAVWLLRPKPEERLLQFDVYPPAGHTFGTASVGRYAVSPDGARLAFVAIASDGKRSLWVRPLAAAEATRLPGTEGAAAPFWDPASRWIAFTAHGKLLKIDTSGGQPQVLCDVTGVAYGTWSRDGVILFADARVTILRVAAAGGSASQVLARDESRKETVQAAPAFLRDGRRFLYTSLSRENGIALGSLDDKRKVRLVNPAFTPGLNVQARDGKEYLLFPRRGQLMAQPFDAASANLRGEPAVIAEPVQPGPSFSASENGILAYRRSRGGRAQLTWFDRDGKILKTAGDPGTIFSPRLSPDQQSAAFYVSDGMGSDIWLFDVERGNTTRLTFGPDLAAFPIWSADGSRIAYSLRRSSENQIVERSANGIGHETVHYRSTNIYYSSGWLAGGHWMLLTDIPGFFYLLPTPSQAPGGEPKMLAFPDSPGECRHPSISPDGRWLLYSSPQTGSQEVFVQSIPQQAGGSPTAFKRQVSIAGGIQPAWRGDGKELFYVAGDGKMMSVSVDFGPSVLKLGLPKPLFQTRLEPDTLQRQYDVTADGKRFLVAQPLEESASAPITVVVNWPDLMKKGTGAP